MSRKIFLLVSILLAFIIIGSLILLSNRQETPQTPGIPIPIASFDPTQSVPSLEGRGVGSEDEEFQNQEREFLEKTPLLQKLPYDQPYFTIEYISETHLIIHARTNNKERDFQAARNWFIENGIDINQIRIDYQ